MIHISKDISKGQWKVTKTEFGQKLWTIQNITHERALQYVERNCTGETICDDFVAEKSKGVSK